MNSKLKLAHVKQINAEDGTIDFTLTERIVDHDGEVIEPSGVVLDAFLKNPVFLWAHDLKHPPLGHVIPETIEVNKKRITGRVSFDMEDPFAAAIFRKFQRKDLNAGSIRFIPIEGDKEPVLEGQSGFTFTKWHLLEFSAVPVPANPAALVRSIEKSDEECDGFSCYREMLKSFYENEEVEHTPEGWLKEKEKSIAEENPVEKKIVEPTEEKDDLSHVIAEMRSRAKHLEMIVKTDGHEFDDSEKRLMNEAFIALSWLLQKELPTEAINLSHPGIEIIDKPETQTIAINGINYSYSLFQGFGMYGLPIGDSFTIIERKDGEISLEKLEQENEYLVFYKRKSSGDMVFKEEYMIVLAGNKEDAKKEALNELKDSGEINIESVFLYEKKVVPYKGTPPAAEGTAWSGSQANKRLRNWAAGASEFDLSSAAMRNKFQQGFALVMNDGTNIGDYKLPHHDVLDGQLKTVWNGVRAAMAAILGARGGINASEAERRGAYDHLRRHYGQFDKEPPEFKEYENDEEILKAVGLTDDEFNNIDESEETELVQSLLNDGITEEFVKKVQEELKK
jgi:hypothetical protein